MGKSKEHIEFLNKHNTKLTEPPEIIPAPSFVSTAFMGENTITTFRMNRDILAKLRELATHNRRSMSLELNYLLMSKLKIVAHYQNTPKGRQMPNPDKKRRTYNNMSIFSEDFMLLRSLADEADRSMSYELHLILLL